MRRLVWSEEAKENLLSIRAYVDRFSPAASHRLAVKLVAAAESLPELPERGRPVRSGVRDLLAVRPYLIRYGVTEHEIIIVRICHTAQRPGR